MDTEFCTSCGEKGAEKRCSICKMVIYCDQTCQKLHWFTHKKVCKKLQEQREKHKAEAAPLQQQQNKENAIVVQEATESMEDLSVKNNEGATENENANCVPIAAADD